jgi:hypothetical protein
MSTVSELYTTLDGNDLHIASDEHYQGKVRVLQWELTKFLYKLMGLATDVVFGEHTYCVTHSSYYRFLTSHRAKEDSNDFDLKLLKVLSHGLLMKNHLSEQKSHQLGLALLKAIEEFNLLEAKRLLKQGADPNTFGLLVAESVFDLPKEMDREHFSIKDIALCLQNRYINQPFTAEAAFTTPYLLAKTKLLSTLVEEMRKYGPAETTLGKSCLISREILSVVDRNAFLKTYKIEKSTTPLQKHEEILGTVPKDTLQEMKIISLSYGTLKEKYLDQAPLVKLFKPVDLDLFS